MSDAIKTRLIHVSQIFFASFITVLAATISNGVVINWTLNFWIPLFTAAAAAAFKALLDPVVPVALGGKKQ